MEFVVHRIKDIAKLYSGGDAPEILSDVKTKECCVPVFSNGISQEGLYGYTNKAQILENAITISARGTIGAVFYRREPFLPIVRLISLIPDTKIVSTEFLYYYLKSIHIDGFGTSQQQLTIPFLGKKKIKIIKDISTQKKIASVLSTYDDLIEKNNRKIAILQEMAEEIYKEWFVRFRFPGYKTAKFKDGIPEGWNIKRLEEFGTIETGKTPSTEVSEYYGTDIPFVKTPDMHENMWTIETEEMLSTAGSNSQAKKLLPANSIMVSCIGTGGVVSINAVPSHTNQQINSIILNDLNELEWLFFTCVSLKPTIVSYGSTGATMTNLSKSKFEKLKILYPGKLLAHKYHDKTKEIFFNIRNLMYLNKNLKTQRDLLLPRLMSGKLEVKA